MWTFLLFEEEKSMNPICPECQSTSVKKNGHIHNGKQNHRCLSCGRQFVENPEKKIIPEEVKGQIQQALLERVSLEGICRIFNVSMPWLLRFLDEIIASLPEHLNATAVRDGDFEVAVLELDEQWSYVGNKKNQEWLWLVFHSESRQVLAMHVGKRTRQSAEILLKKLPEDLKKKPSFTQISFLCTSKSFLGNSIGQLGRNQVRRATLKDLTTPSGNDAQGL